MSWTDERIDLLRKLWLDGLSASRIAAELADGVTRNAVIGKVHRLGLSGRVKAVAPPAQVRPREAAPQVPVRPAAVAPHRSGPLRSPVALAAPSHTALQPQRASGDVVPMSDCVTIMDLRESMCRWPVGDPMSSEFRYCGDKASAGEGPYCAFHSRMAYQPTQDRRRERKFA